MKLASVGCFLVENIENNQDQPKISIYAWLLAKADAPPPV